MPLWRKKFAASAFLMMMAFFGAILAYLFFFNTGLEIIQNPALGESGFYLKNSSSHIIRDATVKAVDGEKKTLLIRVPKLMPGESAKIELPEQAQSSVTLLAEAPHHLSVSRVVSIQREREVKLSHEIIVPEKVPVGVAFALKLKLCNQGPDIEGVEIEQVFPQGFFEAEEEKRVESLRHGECRSLNYTLTALKKGTATILFKVKALNYYDKFEAKIEVI